MAAFAALVPMSKGGSSHRLADRLVALLREWDDDGKGTSSRRDVQMALQALGLYANAASVDGLFEEATLVLDGRLKYDALGRTLRRGAARVDKLKDRDARTRMAVVAYECDERAQLAAMDKSLRLKADAALQAVAARRAAALSSPGVTLSSATSLPRVSSLPTLGATGSTLPAAHSPPQAPRSVPERGRTKTFRKSDTITLRELQEPPPPKKAGVAAAAATAAPAAPGSPAAAAKAMMGGMGAWGKMRKASSAMSAFLPAEPPKKKTGPLKNFKIDHTSEVPVEAQARRRPLPRHPPHP